MSNEFSMSGKKVELIARPQDTTPRRPAWGVYVDGVCIHEGDCFHNAADAYEGALRS